MRHEDGSRRSAVVRVERLAASDWPLVAPVWKALADLSPYATFFISPDWVEAWLEQFAPRFRVEVLVFRSGDEPVCACLLVRRTLLRGPFPVRVVYLNTAGEDPADTVWTEFNNLLCLPGWEEAVAKAVLGHLGQGGWDEIHLDGFCQGPVLEAFRNASPPLLTRSVVRANFFVNLARLRGRSTPYESALGSKDRARLRQNYRKYGAMTVRVPDTVPGMLAALEELAALHQKTWTRRGRPGAFASAAFRAFHQGLIGRAGPTGGIQVSRVAGAEGVIGVLYNMVYRGRVYFYQSGLAYSDDKRIRPGFVALAKTIEYCLTNTHAEEFHLMPGGEHYKEPMSTDREDIEWLILLRPTLKNRALQGLRGLKHRLQWARGHAPEPS